MIELKRSETIVTEQGRVDSYLFEEKTGISRKDITVFVDFGLGEITGDCVAFGDWFDIDSDECKEYLGTLMSDEIIRDFSSLVKEAI